MNLLTAFLAWRDRKRAERQLVEAERARNALMRQIHYRRDHHQPHRPMIGLLQQATNASLRASTRRGG